MNGVASLDRPNLLVIMADQLRHDWLSVCGTPGVSTPAIDGLSARGVRFTNLTTNSAICVPARLALATGLRPERINAWGNEAMLQPGDTTYYQRLRDSGYRVGIVGKLDLAKRDIYNGYRGDRPQVYSWGFTHPLEAEGKMHARGHAGKPLGPYGFWLQERGLFESFCEDYERRMAEIFDALTTSSAPPYAGTGLYRDSVLPSDAFEDVWLGERAVEWIQTVPDDFPWHLFVSFVGPHDPFDPPTEWADQFRDAPVPDHVAAVEAGRPGYVWPSRWGLSSEEVRAARRQYSAATALIDAQVARILDVVRKRGLEDNTYVVFTSDHGEMLGDLGLFEKSVAYDPAMRVPLIVVGPDIAPGVVDAPVELADLNPTLCDLARLTTQPGLDARSFTPLLRNDTSSAARTVAVCSQQHYRAIRSTTHKYIANRNTHRFSRPDDPDEVYDLIADPYETRNLVVEDPETADRIVALLVALERKDAGRIAQATATP